jgi:hypothetical protein
MTKVNRRKHVILGLRLATVLCMFLLNIGSVCAETAEIMLSSCEGVVDAQVTEQGIALPTDFETGKCWGAFSVLETVSGILEKLPSDYDLSRAPNDCLVADKQTALIYRSILGLNIPQGVSRKQVITIFVNYAKRHPEKLHADFFLVARDAIREAFPCGGRTGTDSNKKPK